MEPLDTDVIRNFLLRLSERETGPVQLVLLGGSALLLLGGTRTTLDIDYVGDDLHPSDLQRTIAEVAGELRVHADPVPIERFVPLPVGSDARKVFI